MNDLAGCVTDRLQKLWFGAPTGHTAHVVEELICCKCNETSYFDWTF